MVIINYFKKLNIVSLVIEPGIIGHVRVARINRLRKGGGLEITFQVLLSKRLKFCSSPADNNSEYFIIAKYACF